MGKIFNIRWLILILVLVALLMVSGCASYPKVTYLSLPSKDADGAIKYYLQGSLVTLAVVGSQESQEQNGSGQDKKKKIGNTEFLKISISDVEEIGLKNVRAIVTATESRKHFYAIKPHESVWSKTSVSVSYIDNTRLIKSIGTSFEDNRIKVIESAGAIITSLLPMFGILCKAPGIETEAGKKETLNLPVVIDLTEMNDAESIAWSKIPGHEQWWYRIELLKPQSDSKKSLEYFKEIDGTTVRALAYSSCQDAKLLVTNSESQPPADKIDTATFNIRIANPNYVCTLNFPAKGSIAMHSICGADIKTEESKEVSNLDIVEALVKQIEAIKKAQTDDSKAK
ncbi:MAG: hypothetical protein ABII68_00775 [Pseudomonadota bacterium]